MKRFLFFLFVASAGMQVLNGCKSAQTTASNSVEVSEDGNKIILTDRTGKKWDISHAVKNYGFEVNGFEFGLGPFAIRPFIDPEFLSPGDTGYPADGADFLIMGTNIHGDARAYRITDMSWHEVADDQFGEAHVAVAYWPLVQLAAVYSREIDDEVLTLSASGWTYRKTFVLFDYESESLWYHLEGEEGLTCIGGKWQDRKLTELPSTVTRWIIWKQEHPNTKLLNY